MNKALLTFLSCLVTFVALGQDDKSYIEVMGSAETEISPDIIIVSIRLKEYEEGKEKVSLEQIERDFLNAVAKSGVGSDRVTISDLTLKAIRQRKRDRDLYAQKTYEISFSKSQDVLTLLDNLRSVQLDYLDIVKLSHTDIEKYRLDTKVQALKAAEKKADALLNSVGAKRGRVLFIDESPDGPIETWRPGGLDSNALYNIIDKESLGISEVPLKKIKLRFEVLARFEIE